jgi:L-iditol 2-dehydrogenase
MLRIIKPEGFGNIQLEEVPIPQIGPGQVLVRTNRTLISRGSELFARYNQERAVSPEIMGYSLTGVVERVGPAVTGFAEGDRVMVVAPHAQYAVGEVGSSDVRREIIRLPDSTTFEAGTFLPLITSAVAWSETPGIRAGDVVVILGQGIVGALMLQAVRRFSPGAVVAVDALALRCAKAKELGADHVVDAASQDPVEVVRSLTGGRGADVVMDCVGGNAGIRSFEQAQEMVRRGGTLHLISLYQGAPLPLHSGKIMNKRLLAGILSDESYQDRAARAANMLADGVFRVEQLITHRFAFQEARAAFDLLWNAPGEALGVLFTWD